MQGQTDFFAPDVLIPEMERLASRCITTFRLKHQDYGSSIGFHGVEGLMPRIADKFFRLNHMVWDHDIPNFESAIDSAEDLVVYAMILASVLRTMGVASELA